MVCPTLQYSWVPAALETTAESFTDCVLPGSPNVIALDDPVSFNIVETIEFFEDWGLNTHDGAE
jgi:hypothetical protein